MAIFSFLYQNLSLYFSIEDDNKLYTSILWDNLLKVIVDDGRGPLKIEGEENKTCLIQI